ncbi:hypothetical protein [Paractinoplanes globisporus]|uniref:Uncharacterized protein n=1 Tax=Paractinoplanes globisporus TaxID=113565 RepID=A0ABW6WLD3_9ACTN|nr:hypothetical protein [Actinoplanes globisporus]
MTRIAISGHRDLSTAVENLVDHAIRDELSRFDPSELVGLSCLADGADQIFARAVVDLGGKLEIFVPASHYRESLPSQALDEYDELMSYAVKVHNLDHVDSTSESHMEASVQMLQHADLLFAVWDGLPARGFGGTADVVAHAEAIGVMVTVIWPDGAVRD